MINVTERPGASWWALVRGMSAACWWRLLVVEVLLAVAGLAVTTVGWMLVGAGLPPVGYLVVLAAGGLAAAWKWSAALRILDGGHGILPALRPDPRRTGRLWLWLVALDLAGLMTLLEFVGGPLIYSLDLPTVLPAIELASLYLAFAAALLPMAVLLEGRGFGRAWRLSHGGWRAVLRVLPVVLIGSAASSALEQGQIGAIGSYPPPAYLLLLQPVAALIGALLSTVTTVLLYAAYRLSAPHPATAEHQQARTAGATV
ncbi:hypothetical protein AB0K43_02110 [Kitasatospora sp. NPDC049258]|uniref:hypothetical protein n=1 Tax=Kitasatospora sp. NPDC049258 TaxID=3155394 RepID=UPI0034348081